MERASQAILNIVGELPISGLDIEQIIVSAAIRPRARRMQFNSIAMAGDDAACGDQELRQINVQRGARGDDIFRRSPSAARRVGCLSRDSWLREGWHTQLAARSNGRRT